jgi:phage baseplate assembly protein W
VKSLAAPFQIVGGKIDSTDDPTRIIEQKIVNVMTTGKLERPMIPDYGAGTQQLLFDNIDELVEVDFRSEAATELANRVSGLNLVDIRIEQTDETTASITVSYRTTLSGVRSTTFSVALPGLLTEETPI